MAKTRRLYVDLPEGATCSKAWNGSLRRVLEEGVIIDNGAGVGGRFRIAFDIPVGKSAVVAIENEASFEFEATPPRCGECGQEVK